MYTNVVQRLTLTSDASNRFAGYMLSEAARQLKGHGVSIESLNFDLWKRLKLCFPPLPEQLTIADYLDGETAKIDRLIEGQRRLIELLKEKRQAVISQAVTLGIDPSARLKPFDRVWAKNIPKHWEVKLLFTVATFRSGEAHEPHVSDDGPYILVNSRFISTDGVSRKFCARNLSPATRNDILMVMSDLPNGRALAKAFLVEDDSAYAVNQRVCIVSPFAMQPRFMYYMLNRHPELLSHDDGANQTHLWNDLFKKLPVLVPPLEEQESIACFLDLHGEMTSALLKETEVAMTLLQERRAALISAAVTGKIDVRKYVPHETAASEEVYELA